MLPALGKVKLKDLRPSMLKAFYLDLMEEKNLSAKSVTYVHNVLKAALKAAAADRLIEENPCLNVTPPKIKKYKARLLSQEQLVQLFAHLAGNRYETEIKLAAVLGLRQGEVLGLKFSDVDWKNHTLMIQRQVTYIRDKTNPEAEKYYGLKSLKSESSERKLCLSDDVEKLIQRKLIFNEAQKRRLGIFYEDNDLICCNDDGTIMSPQTLYHAFKRVIKQRGLPDVRFHNLRHSYATLCIDLNIPIKVISQSLEHSSTAVTDEVYADSISAKKALAEMISKAVGGWIEQTAHNEAEKKEKKTSA